MPNHVTMSFNRFSRPAVGAVAAAVLGLAASSSALGQAGTFTISMNNGAVHSVTSVASLNAEPGTLRYTGSSVDPAGKWEASWDYVADLDPTGNAKLVGEAVVVNHSNELAEFEVRFQVPVCPFIVGGAKMGGSCTILLVASENGGVVSCTPGNQVFTAMADDVAGPKLFHGPFNMGTTGSGTCQTQNLFGAPFPGMNVPEVTSDFGVRHVFRLTDADKVVITTHLVLGGNPDNFVECEGDATASAALPAGAPEESGQQVARGSGVAPGAPSSSSIIIGARDQGEKRVIAAKGAPAPRQAAPKRSSPAGRSNSNNRTGARR